MAILAFGFSQDFASRFFFYGIGISNGSAKCKKEAKKDQPEIGV